MSGVTLPVLAGPTCTGKTRFAILLAEQHGMEIVSADSRQIYRRLDVGTAKPTPEEQARVAHHVIDVCEPTEHYNLARFIEDAERAIEEIRRRGKRPLLVGGTGMYIRGLTLGTFDDGSRDTQVREALQARIEREGPEALHAELARIDPEAAARIHPNDAFRIVRALEVWEVTGEAITALQRRSREEGPRHSRRVAVLDVEKPLHDEWIAERTGRMFDGGLLEETQAVLDAGGGEDAPGLRAIGYPQAVAHLRGVITRGAAIDQVATQTRRYAKRQRTWFRSEEGAQWIDAGAGGERKILDALRKTLAID